MDLMVKADDGDTTLEGSLIETLVEATRVRSPQEKWGTQKEQSISDVV